MGVTITDPVSIDNSTIINDSNGSVALGKCQFLGFLGLDNFTVVSGSWLLTSTYTIYGSTQNGEITYPVFIPEGDLTFNMRTTTRDNAGIGDVYLDDTQIGSIDCYSAVLTTDVLKSFNFTNATAGFKTLKFKVPTKNGSSTGYRFYITYVYVGEQ
jgi:hypothetical protein